MDGTPTLSTKEKTLNIKSVKTNITTEDATAHEQLRAYNIIK